MTIPQDRIYRAIPVVLLIALAGTMAVMLQEGIATAEFDPDTVLIQLTLLVMAVLVFILTWKYRNILLTLGLALIIYTSAVQIIEEFTRDFLPWQFIFFSILLFAGFFLVMISAIMKREETDRDIEYMRQQEARLVAGAQEQARLQTALEQSNRSLRLLTGITRHDIANRLHAASGFIELIRNTHEETVKGEYLSRAEQNLSAIGDIIAFTKTYEMIGMDAPGWQEISPLIGDTIRALNKNGVSMENCVGQDLVVFADSMIGKVFFNLIDNSLAYAGGNRIAFSAERSEQGLVIICEDNGVGIPATDKERIFERGVGKHTGLGLFLSREILSLTGITIRETGSEGAGARFEILVPEGKFRFGSGITDDRAKN